MATVSFPLLDRRRDDVEVPHWFDRRLLGELYRKRNRPRGPVSLLDTAVFAAMERIVRKKSWRFSRDYDWAELEEYVEHDCRAIADSGFQPDAIVGIKSGGAFIANYVGRLLGVSEIGYVKVQRYTPIWGSSVLALLIRYFGGAKLTAEVELDLEGCNVLLVDDQTCTGKSLTVARQWVEARGAKSVKTYCVFTQGFRPDYGTREGIMLNSPWGDDP